MQPSGARNEAQRDHDARCGGYWTAAKKMRDRDIGVLPVCDGENLLGVLSDREITIRALAVSVGCGYPPCLPSASAFYSAGPSSDKSKLPDWCKALSHNTGRSKSDRTRRTPRCLGRGWGGGGRNLRHRR
ncbi:MAG: CBS domain-containing protein [Gemmatimonadaceae bacterium]